MKRSALLVAAVVMMSCAPVFSETRPQPLDLNFGEDVFLPDFSYAGYRNGDVVLPRTKGRVFAVNAFGAVADDGKDDTRAIRQALAEAADTAGPVVIRFGAGRYRITEVLRIERGEITLQGAGMGEGGTTLFFPRPLKQVDKSAALDELRQYIVELDKRQKEPEMNLNEYFSEYSWTGGFLWVQKPGTRAAAYLESYDPPIDVLAQVRRGQRGERSIELTDPAAIRPGDIVQLQWINRTGPDAPIIRSLYGDAASSAGSHHWTFKERPLVRQTSRVVAVDGARIDLADPLLHDAGAGIPAQVASWDGLEQVAIEDVHLEFPVAPYFGHHMERGYNGIYMTSAFDSFVRNVRITNADSGILSYNSANLTYQNITTDGVRKAHYAVHMGNVHNVLAQDVRIFNPVLHSLTFNTQSTKCVYQRAEVFQSPTLDQHAGANHQNLFDQVTLHVRANPGEQGPVVPAFDGSGAPYWQPGHGGFNTTWNLRLLITGGAYPDEPVTVQGLDEGPMARVIGLHGNRSLKLDYRPVPFVRYLNRSLGQAPSLYDHQRARRMANRSD